MPRKSKLKIWNSVRSEPLTPGRHRNPNRDTFWRVYDNFWVRHFRNTNLGIKFKPSSFTEGSKYSRRNNTRAFYKLYLRKLLGLSIIESEDD